MLQPIDKHIAYKDGMYSAPPPQVPHKDWSDEDWIEYIDSEGSWPFPLQPYEDECMVEVTREKFMDTVGRMNVHPNSKRYHTAWKTPIGTLAGWSTPGYLIVPCGDEYKRYWIREVLK